MSSNIRRRSGVSAGGLFISSITSRDPSMESGGVRRMLIRASFHACVKLHSARSNVKRVHSGAIGAQHELGDAGVEARAVGAAELVETLHAPFRRLENAEALVLVHVAGADQRLLAPPPLAPPLGFPRDGTVDFQGPPSRLPRLPPTFS